MNPRRLAVFALAAPLLLLTGCGGGTAEQPEPELATPAPPPPPPPAPPAEEPDQTAASAEPSAEASAPKARTLSVALAARSKSKVTGTVTLTEVDGGVKVSVQVSGAKPGDHGMHVHEKADCSAPDAKTAGDHFNPDKSPHALPDADKKHLGDLGNITVGQDGTGTAELTVKGANLKEGDPMSFIGRSVIVHDKKDDGSTQPSGNSGNRIACAELVEGGAAAAAASEDAAAPSKPAAGGKPAAASKAGAGGGGSK